VDTVAVWHTATAILVSLGGGGAIVLALSAWLGRVWAEKLMAKDAAAHARQLEEFRSGLAAKNDYELETLKRRNEIEVTSHLREVQDKVAIYPATADMMAEMLTTFDRAAIDGSPPSDMAARIDRFNRDRMRIYGYLAMLAPQGVMDCYDALIDHLINILGGHVPYEWGNVRNLVLAMVNEIRRDIGLNKDPIHYSGEL
jgi:hypothetical protein